MRAHVLIEGEMAFDAQRKHGFDGEPLVGFLVGEHSYTLMPEEARSLAKGLRKRDLPEVMVRSLQFKVCLDQITRRSEGVVLEWSGIPYWLTEKAADILAYRLEMALPS